MNVDGIEPIGWKPLFKADWTRFVFIHYSLPPEDLAAYTPLELDCRDGRAFVSLVFFRLERMRPARAIPDRLGRILFRPASDNWFLNVRTYVRGAAGPGIQFLIEWMDNPISLRLGPWLYGLPYRSGKFDCPIGGQVGPSSLRVTDVETKEALQVSVLDDARGPEAVAKESLDGFLLEKYTAYTHHRGVSRFFRISHPNWKVARPTVLEVDDELIRNRCPWFEHVKVVSAHSSAGFQDVAMGFPQRLRSRAPFEHLSSTAQVAPYLQ